MCFNDGMIRLVHLDRSRSERIIWLLEELGLPYALETFLRGPDLYGPDELRQAHALGRAPVIQDGDVELAESGAIVEYILARYGNGRLSVAPSEPTFPRYLYWLHYAEGSLMLQLLREWSLERMLPDADAHPGMARFREGTRTHLAMIEDALSASPYLAGDRFTAADIMMAYPLTTFFRHIRPLDLTPYPAIRAYVGRLETRPAFRKATERTAVGPG
jgi:glutathione S-transferase